LAQNTAPCRRDLFASGAYGGKKKPICNSKRMTRLSCCAYFGKCKRKYIASDDAWSSCECGKAIQSRPVDCELEKELGDCRYDKGDPGDPSSSVYGYCKDGKCWQKRECLGRNCPWQKYCAVGENQSDHRDCIAMNWGPPNSGCAWGESHAYKRCSVYPDATSDGNSLCNESVVSAHFQQIQRDFKENHLVAIKSEIPYCAVCPLGPDSAKVETECSWCAAPGLFNSASGNNMCSNSKPFVRVVLTVMIPQNLQEALVSTHGRFSDFERCVKNALAADGAWEHEVSLLDVFHKRDVPDSPPLLAVSFLSSLFAPASTYLRYLRSRLPEITTSTSNNAQSTALMVNISCLGRLDCNRSDKSLGEHTAATLSEKNSRSLSESGEPWVIVAALWSHKDVVNDEAMPNPVVRINASLPALQLNLDKQFSEMFFGASIQSNLDVSDLELICTDLQTADNPWDWRACRHETKKNNSAIWWVIGILIGIAVLSSIAIYIFCYRRKKHETTEGWMTEMT